MRLLLFVSAFGILISLGVLIAVIIKAKRQEQDRNPVIEIRPRR